MIEVLVVVAIIALLISILLPSLVAARREAKKVLCGSNLHQIGVGITAYVSANKGQLPVRWRSASSFTTYFMRFGRKHGGSVGLNLLANRRYVPEPEAFYCPGQDPTKSAALAFNGPNNKWISDAAYSGMSVAEQNAVKLRSSYMARPTMPEEKPQIGTKPREVLIPSSELVGWRQDKYYQQVIYSDFTGVDGFDNTAINEGYVFSPHDKKGNYRLFGDTSARWVHIEVLEKSVAKIGPDVTVDQMIAFWKQLDR